MRNVATIHIPLDKKMIMDVLNAEEFMVNTMVERGMYYYKL